WMGLFCMEALSKLPGAINHADKIKKFLRHSDGDFRRAARKLLNKLGVKTEIPPAPPPVHLFKGSIPRGLEEWSTNLDMDELAPNLQRLAQAVDKGFGQREMAEVASVAEGMHHDQTRTFKFPISAAGQKADLFIEILIDDIDSPDLAFYSVP